MIHQIVNFTFNQYNNNNYYYFLGCSIIKFRTYIFIVIFGIDAFISFYNNLL